MLKMIQKRLPIELSKDAAALIQQNLQTRFNSLFYRIRLEYLSRLGLETSDYALTTPADSDLIIGELFMPEPGLICYLKGLRNSGYIEAGAVTNEAGHDLEVFFTEVRDAICEVLEGIPAWETLPEYAPLEIEGAIPGNVSIDPKEMAAARVIMDSTSRDLLAKIKEAGSIFINQLYTEDREDIESRIRTFESLKLLSKEYAVLCRRTGQQILRVADRSTLDESSQKSFKCFICGSPISQEVIEEIVTSNELCAEMFNDNKWLLVLIQGILGELGVESEAIKVYRDPNLPTRLFLSLNGQRYLVVLCTESLTLDQANLIGAHLSAYDLHQAIIISTCNISTLMRHHLAKSSANTKFHFICDLQDLDGEVERILISRQREYVTAQLDDISKATPVSIPSLVLSRMLPQKEEDVVEYLASEAPSENIEETATQLEEAVAELQEEAETIPAVFIPELVAEEVPTIIAAPGEEKSSKKHKKGKR